MTTMPATTVSSSNSKPRIEKFRPSLWRRTPYRAEDWFNADELAEARRYAQPLHRIKMLASGLSMVALVVFIGTKAGPRLLDWSGIRGWALQLIVVSLVLSLVELAAEIGPSSYVKLVYDRRWGLSNVTGGRFLADSAKELAINTVMLAALLLPVYAAIHVTDWWFLWGWAAFMLVQITIAFVYPIVIMPRFNKFTPLPDGELRQRIEQVAALTGTTIQGVYTMDASKRSSRSNAFVAGFGATKRVVLFDTILEFPMGEIEQVVAHEIGHYRLWHVFKTVAAVGGLFLVSFAFVGLAGRWDWLLHRAGVERLGDPGALPVFLLLLALAWSVLSVAEAWHSRRNEREADLEALELLRRPEEFIDLWQRFGPKDKVELQPSWWTRVKHSHPEVAERMAFSRKWAEANGIEARSAEAPAADAAPAAAAG